MADHQAQCHLRQNEPCHNETLLDGVTGPACLGCTCQPDPDQKTAKKLVHRFFGEGHENLQAAIVAAIRAERKQCVKIVERYQHELKDSHLVMFCDVVNAQRDIALAIRERTEGK